MPPVEAMVESVTIIAKLVLKSQDQKCYEELVFGSHPCLTFGMSLIFQFRSAPETVGYNQQGLDGHIASGEAMSRKQVGERTACGHGSRQSALATHLQSCII